MEDKKQKNKKMTLDALASMIGQGFNGVDKRFEGMDQRFTGVDQAIAGIDQRFAKMDQKIEALTTEVRNGFKKVHKEISKINLNVVDVVRMEDFNKLEKRVVDAEEVLALGR